MKNRNKINTGIFLMLLVFIGSCEGPPWGCVRGNGRIVSEERVIGEFNKIVSSGSFVVDIVLSNETALIVETDENLLPYIETNIQGATLVIETKNDRCIKSREAITIYVDATSIEKLKLSGSGEIYCDNISGEILELNLSGSGTISCFGLNLNNLLANLPGSGEIKVGGTASIGEYDISGSGNIKGIGLLSDKCYANISGSGNIYTTVTELLDANISGSGNIYYQGDPEVIKIISGSGNIREYK